MAYVYPQNNPQLINPPSQGFLGRPLGLVYRPILPQFHPSILVRMDVHMSLSLLQYMENEGLVPSPEEELKRKAVIEKLKKIVLMWVKRIAWQRGLAANVCNTASATVLTYGSYGLGVHGSESDIDALCVGPGFATMTEDFFVVLCNMLKNTHGVSDIHCVKDAKVPLMRLKFEGIAVDLPYARLQVMSVPENVDLLNPVFLTCVDEYSRKSLSGVRVNQRILQLVPNVENFQSLLRCIKFWAKRRGVYGNLFGFLGGMHLAIMAALICQRNPNACLSVLVMSFFSTFASWQWPTPIVLQDGVQIMEDMNDRRSLMPIRLPSSCEYCQSNITRSTFNRIRAEFLLAANITKELLRPDFDWDNLFEPFVYQKIYSRFLKIRLSACDNDDLGDWVGWVKSRFPGLIQKLEEMRCFCDPNPTEYAESGTAHPDPSVVFYWGLHQGRELNVSSLGEGFRSSISNGYQGRPGRLELAIAPASELPANTPSRTRACWRIPHYDQRRVPLFSRHLPSYFIGYLATEGDYPTTTTATTSPFV